VFASCLIVSPPGRFATTALQVHICHDVVYHVIDKPCQRIAKPDAPRGHRRLQRYLARIRDGLLQHHIFAALEGSELSQLKREQLKVERFVSAKRVKH